MTSNFNLRPVFAGKTEDDERIVLYRSGQEFHLKKGDAEIVKLNPGAKLSWWSDTDKLLFHIEVESVQWTGRATGSKQEFIEVGAI